MSEDIAHPVFLDATVLSNFASSGTVAQLVAILDRSVAVPAVREELERGHEQSYGFLSDALDHLGEDIDLIEIADPEEWREKRGYYAPVDRIEDILE